ncbi:MAG: sensor histidine kinase [Terriglobia bacterium]
MKSPSVEHDLLAEIPSASLRLWVGLCVILSIFVVFAVYSIHQIRWLEDYQINVVQRNRRASIVLLRLQGDAHWLGILLRDITSKQAQYPIADSDATLSRIHGDMSNALALERRYAINTPETNAKAEELQRELNDFWGSANSALVLSQRGREADARRVIANGLEGRDSVIVATLADLLRLNDQAQIEAARRITSIYGSFKRDNFILLAVLLLLAAATGLYTFQANRKTIERLGHLAEKLQSQSGQLRKLSWKLIDVQEETLRQVAHDLHDEFGQILTAIGIMLNRAGQRMEPEAAPLLGDLQSVRAVVEETLQNVRDRSQMLRPAILDDFGLGKTLAWFVEQFSRQTGVSVHLLGNPDEISYSGDDAIHIYRIVQEALSNVARHGGATEAWVELGQDEVFLMLEIRDRGRGFSPGAEMDKSAGEGFGLMGMRERAQRLNGTLEIRSAPGQGTTVSARIPLRQPQREPAGEEVRS